MFTQSIPAPAPAPTPSSTGLHAASPATPASPTSRTSRLRGLSYLRNYTQSHILNREHSSAGAVNTSGGNSGIVASNGSSGNSNLPTPSSPSTSNSGLVRSADTYPLRQTQSASAAPSPSPSVAATASAVDPRLFLVPAVSHPLTTTPANSSQSASSDSIAQQPGSLAAGETPTGDSAAPSTTTTAPSAAVSSLQAAYRSDLQPSVSAPTANANSAAAASLSAVSAMATAGSPQAPAAAASVMTRSRSATEPGVAAPGNINSEALPSIRFSPFHDPRATRPSLKFAPMSRTLPTGKELIKVGRYSERDGQPAGNANIPSAAHVGFKSKVVSRRHCEFWHENNRWYIKDVKSSSGTFLNHIRLSQPGIESKPFPVNDGDIVQLGIDFKGGEEMIFRCVKMRIELNRGWQNKLNAFNVQSHKRLRNLTKAGDDGSKQSSQDCAICLNSIAPCQSLFVAPCSHTWHYKCIRSLLESPQYPNFICPNCRAAVDLEADIEEPAEEWETIDEEESLAANASDVAADSSSQHVQPRPPSDQRAGASPAVASAAAAVAAADTGDATIMMDTPMEDIDDTTSAEQQQQLRSEQQELDSRVQQQLLGEQQQQEGNAEPEPENHVSHATSHPVPIPSGSRHPSVNGLINGARAVSINGNGVNNARTPSPTERHVAPSGHEGPITPRNDAGPWVFDGSGIRIGSSRASTDSRRGEMRSLDTAAAEISRNA